MTADHFRKMAENPPKPTSDVPQGKSNLDRYGYTIHQNLLSGEELRRLRHRFTPSSETVSVSKYPETSSISIGAAALTMQSRSSF